MHTSVPFQSKSEGYFGFRIPAIVVSSEGTLLAFAEGRRNSLADAGDIDVVLKRSSDGGQTWGPLQVLHVNGADTAGNPTPVVAAGGRIVLLTVTNGGTIAEGALRRGEVASADARRIFLQFSEDDGLSWTEAKEITEQVKSPSWRWYATGPCHGIRLRHSGRLVVPACHSLAPRTGSEDTGSEPRYYGGHCLISDDNGDSWRIGFVDDGLGPDGEPTGYINANETTVVELPDGRLYFNTRNQGGTGPGTRADSYSEDGGETLSTPYRPQATLVGPVVQGSVLRVSDRLVFAGPADADARAALTLRVSNDDGATWQNARALSGLPAAYSDLVEMSDSQIGVLYETGDLSAYETITFRVVRAL